ncbi:MAG: hypothetical protein M0P11_09455, partial [Anaerolineaceae bacterium]|nr:hypothetical protein [Anaerolineaceae bacterium]
MNQSSAQKIVEKLQSLGIQQDKITQDHLMLCYADLKKIKSVPDFKSAKAILVKMSDKIKYDSAEIVGVIVETRCHPALEKIVSIFTSHLNIPIQIFHGLNNRNYILNTEIKQLVDKGKVCLTELPTENLQAKTYNALFLSESFWSFMMGRRKVLVFQTDAICCPNSDYRLNEFLSFDYIGSLWPQERPVGLLMNGGVGGLSLRDWKKSVDCLKRFSPVLWPGG